MNYLNVYVYPAQMITIQLQRDNKVIESTNCPFNDTINKIQEYLKGNFVDTVTVVGQTNYADKMEQLVEANFRGSVNIERVH